jgi:subtilase family serine protease
MQRRSRIRAAGLALAVAPVVVAALVAIPSNANAATVSGRAVLSGSKPTWAKVPAHSAAATAVARTATGVGIHVYLAPKTGEAALKAEVAAVSTPGNALYRHFLTSKEYNAKFAPSNAEVAAVSAWLKQAGFKVTSIGTGNRYVEAYGNVNNASKAFDVSFAVYQHGRDFYRSPMQNASVPRGLANSVISVVGLDSEPHLMTHQNLGPPAAFRNARPCSLYFGEIEAQYQADFKTPLPQFANRYLSYAPCGYTPPYLNAAYTGQAGLYYDGTGTTVAIVDAYDSPTLLADADTYSALNGDPTFNQSVFPAQFQNYPMTPYTHVTACGGNGWYPEQHLDVEAVHSIAPGADIAFVGAASCYDTDLLNALFGIVNQDEADVITNSWGSVESGETSGLINAYEQVFQQAAVEGISISFSSGDDGDNLYSTGQKQPDYPASDPYITAVGGTSTGIDGNGNISFQSGWGTYKYSFDSSTNSWNPVGWLYGAGGGFSDLFNRPSWQDSVVPADYPPGRAVPDVAMDADPNTGMLIGETETFPDGTTGYNEARYGGTSLASPLFAGMVALADEAAGGGSNGGGLGFLDPALYAMNGSTNFYDIAPSHTSPIGDVRVDYANGFDSSSGLLYSVRTFDQDLGLATSKGWDDVTGIGVPTPNFITSFPPVGGT